jgi:hypothetical protein
MKITSQIFKGIRPIMAPHLLGEGEAQTAENCNLASGALRPWFNEVGDSEIDMASVQSIYLYLSTYWLAWQAGVDIVSSPIASDTYNRRYYTGDGIPKKTNQTEGTTGSGIMPRNFYPMAVPIPAVAPTATPSGSGGAGDDRLRQRVNCGADGRDNRNRRNGRLSRAGKSGGELRKRRGGNRVVR